MLFFSPKHGKGVCDAWSWQGPTSGWWITLSQNGSHGFWFKAERPCSGWVAPVPLGASTRTMRHGRRVGTFPRIRRRSGRENPSHVIFGGCGGTPFAVAWRTCRLPSVLFRGVLSLNSGRRTSSRVLGRGTKSSFPPAWETRAMWWCHSWPNGSIWMVGWKKAIWKFGKQRMDLMYKWSPWKHRAQRNFYRGSKTASGSIKTRSCGTWKTTRIPIFHWCMLTSLPQKPGKLFKSFWISCPQPKWAASFSILVRNPGLSSWLRRVASHAFRGFVVWRANVMILRSTMCSRWPLWLGGFLWPAQASSNALFGDLRVGWNNSGRTEWPRSAGMLPFTKDPSVSSFDHPACFAHGWGGTKGPQNHPFGLWQRTQLSGFQSWCTSHLLEIIWSKV